MNLSELLSVLFLSATSRGAIAKMAEVLFWAIFSHREVRDRKSTNTTVTAR